MVSHGFNRNSFDCCVYHSKLDDGSMIYLLLYVDDMLVATKKKSDVAASCLCQTEEELAYMSKVPYANAVGFFMYSMIFIKPDIAHAVSVVSRFMARLGREHRQGVKRIFAT